MSMVRTRRSTTGRPMGCEGVWVDIFDILAVRPPAQILIDSSAVKAHRCASGAKGEQNQAIGSRGGRTTKIHA